MKFIAEMCQNHSGSIEVLERMVREAKDNGATHAKIQAIYVSELNFRSEFENPDTESYRPFEKEFARLSSLELSPEDEKQFVSLCHDIQIIPMITTFTHSGAERAKENGFKSIKIASYDCSSRSLIRTCLKFANEIVISTGATSWQEVEKTSRDLSKHKKTDLAIGLLHARTLYPCNLNEARLGRIWLLREFGFPVGFSDHSSPKSDSLLTSKFAISLGIEYLERHFTIMSPEETKDGPVSVNPQQLKELVDFSQSTSKQKLAFLKENLEFFLESLTLDALEPSHLEAKNASYYRGRFISKWENREILPWDEWHN
jgi:sialic acid synthase SpsE